MAEAIFGGMLKDGFPSGQVIVSDPSENRMATLKSKYPQLVYQKSNSAAITVTSEDRPNIVVLAVKPQVMKSVCQDMKKVVQEHKPLVVTLAAGICEVDYRRWFDMKDLSLVR
jgi:pyrroline-5-carboxylate reductase